ncbi:MAG: bifunctional oligoribonuclease/PAP phosphatase NrnA [Bacteroidetes bacterium]|nr:bifunctional oligoribonuclease/PAP phosphatase NrnA [Bacteroidota bacterium]
MIDFNKLKEIIENNNSFLLTTHVNPDADAIGSEIAFYLMLKEIGKEVHILNHSKTPYNLCFLDKYNIIQKYDNSKHNKIFDRVDVLVALDFNRSNRIVSMEEGFINSDKIKICLDHHPDPEDFFNFIFFDIDYCSTGQIIYQFIKETNIVEFRKELADNLYAAIMTDTGSFKFEKTTSEIHIIAADLLEKGVSPTNIYDSIYDKSRFGKLKLLGLTLKSSQLYGNTNEICFMKLYQKDFEECNVDESDTDGFINFSLSINGVKIGLLFVELKNGFKVSFRSKGNIPINKLAEEYGGGGHRNAAGTRRFNQKLDEQIEEILKRTESYL